MRPAAEEDVAAYCRSHRGKVVATFFESRGVKQLQAAIDRAKSASAVLVIPRSVHISRNLPFLHTLWKGEVQFHICDTKHISADTLVDRIAEAVQRKAAVRETIKEALAEKKAEGVPLGSARPGHWDGRKRRRGWRQAAKVAGENRTNRAREAYRMLEPQIFAMHDKGSPLPEIATYLNSEGFKAAAGKPFTPTAVWRIIHRAKASTKASA